MMLVVLAVLFWAVALPLAGLVEFGLLLAHKGGDHTKMGVAAH